MQVKTGELCRLGANGYNNFWVQFIDTNRETQFLKVFHNHTMQTPPPTFDTSRGAQDLNSSLPVEIRKTQLFDSIAESPTLASMAENSTVCLHGPMSTFNWLFFKILKFSGSSIPGMTSSTHQAHFCLGFIMRMVIVISFAHERKTVPDDYAPELLTRIVQNPTKLNDKIWLTKND